MVHQLRHQRPARLDGAGHHQQSRRPLVQAVDDPRAVLEAGLGEVGQVGIGGEEPVDERSVAVAGAGVGDLVPKKARIASAARRSGG